MDYWENAGLDNAVIRTILGRDNTLGNVREVTSGLYIKNPTTWTAYKVIDAVTPVSTTANVLCKYQRLRLF